MVVNVAFLFINVSHDSFSGFLYKCSNKEKTQTHIKEIKQSDTVIISIHKYPLTFFSANPGINLETEDTKLQNLQRIDNFINLSINKKCRNRCSKCICLNRKTLLSVELIWKKRKHFLYFSCVFIQ